MDMDNSDADFDAYWEEEARNPHRNRIRIGRQYQATIQPLLKKGESDKRKLEDLETLYWDPNNRLKTSDLDDYFSLARALSLFSRVMQSDEENSSDEEDGDGAKADGQADGKASADQQEALTDGVTGNSKTVAAASTDGSATKRSNVAKKKAKDQVPRWHERLNTLEPPLGVRLAIKDLSEYVASHHPTDKKDNGCDLPSADSRERTEQTGEWSEREARLFAKALDVCGKNFGAIKKTFLPWKPVKSIIEYYYKGSDNDNDPNDDQEPGNTGRPRQFLSVNSNKSYLSTGKGAGGSGGGNTGGANTTNNSSSSGKSNGTSNSNGGKDAIEELDDTTESKPVDGQLTGGSKAEGIVLSGKEIKPLRARPKFAGDLEGQEQNSVPGTPSSTVGSLKFFMDGALILKLNAKQQTPEDKKCHWIESSDTPKVVKPAKKVRRHRNCEHDGRSSKNSKQSTDDTETGSLDESSDDESLGSAESKSLPSPPQFNCTPRKAKVKLESNCFVPLPISSPTETTPVSSLPAAAAADGHIGNHVHRRSNEPVKREHLQFNQDHLDRIKRVKTIGREGLGDKWKQMTVLANGQFELQKHRPSPPTAHSGSSRSPFDRSSPAALTTNNVVAHQGPMDLTSSTRKSSSSTPSPAHSPRGDIKSLLSPPPTSGTLDLSAKAGKGGAAAAAQQTYFNFAAAAAMAAVAAGAKSKASHRNSSANSLAAFNEIMKGKP